MASTVAARRPSFEKKRSTSSVNLANNDDDHHGPAQHTRPHKKHFVVHAGRHHSRVPSYGRNLNKLSKVNLAHEGAAAAAKGHHLERGGSNGRSKTRLAAAAAAAATAAGESTAAERSAAAAKNKPVFDLGDSEDETANEDEEEEVEEVIEEPKKSPVKRTAGLKKSSSTKSMERQRSDQGSSRRSNGVGRDQAEGRHREPPTLQLSRQEHPKHAQQLKQQQAQQEQLQQQKLAQYQQQQQQLQKQQQQQQQQQQMKLQFQQQQQQQHLQQQQQQQQQIQQQQQHQHQQQQQQQIQQQQQHQQQQQKAAQEAAQKKQQPVAAAGHTVGSKNSNNSNDTAHEAAIKTARLFGQVGHTAAAPPQLNVDNATGVHVVTTATSSTVNGSYPNSNAMQSRFIDSPGRSGVSTSTSPGYSLSDTRAIAKGRPESIKSNHDNSAPVASPPFTQSSVGKTALGGSGGGSATSVGPSRTQQKLWLQRQHDEDAQPAKRSARPDTWASLAQKEMERVTREFMNARRFKNPVGDGIDRIREHPKLQRRIPRSNRSQHQAAATQEAGMGLSRSLNMDLGRAARAVVKPPPRTSQDDSGIRDTSPERDPVVHAKLMQMWNQALLLPSNE